MMVSVKIGYYGVSAFSVDRWIAGGNVGGIDLTGSASWSGAFWCSTASLAHLWNWKPVYSLLECSR